MAGRKRLKLDPRKSIFISEILSGKSGAEAARAAGVEKKSSARQAHRWQKEPEVAEEIEKGLAAIREGAAVTCETMSASGDETWISPLTPWSECARSRLSAEISTSLPAIVMLPASAAVASAMIVDWLMTTKRGATRPSAPEPKSAGSGMLMSPASLAAFAPSTLVSILVSKIETS